MDWIVRFADIFSRIVTINIGLESAISPDKFHYSFFSRMLENSSG